MQQTTFVLTTSPFTLGQVHLASFVPDVRQPHQDAKRFTRLKALASKCLGLSLTRDKGNVLHVTAERGRIFSLNNPASLFEEIVFDGESSDETQMWLEGCQRRGLQPRFVVAYRTFIDARLSRGQHKVTDVSVHGRAPLSTAQGDPSGTGDLAVEAGRTQTTSARGIMGSPGERIYAVCYRKIKLSKEHGKLRGFLEQSTKWRSFATERDDNGDEEYFQADLAEGDDQEDYELYDVDSNDGGKLIFAIPPV
ncbi:hypothetical protein BDV09DRAFT_200714 [Aspergillus tetrazonus]